MYERIKNDPHLVRSNSFNNSYFDHYMDLVLDYFKNDIAANFSHWPDIEIGLIESIPKNASFYIAANKWFEIKHKVKVLRSEKTQMRRFLASFIIVAGYPPHLGFQSIVHGVAWRSNWENIRDNPRRELLFYIEEHKHAFNLLQKNLLKENSEAYESLVSLLSVLAELRYLSLSMNDKKETINLCSQKHEQYSVMALEKIFTVYEDVFKISGRKRSSGKKLAFSYKIEQLNSEEPVLILNSNITSSGSVILDRKIPKMTNIRFSTNSSGINIPDFSLILTDDNDVSSIESKTHGIVKLSVTKLNTALKDIEVFITGSDNSGYEVQNDIYSITRSDDFLVFDEETGDELLSPTYEYKKGYDIIIVPLSKEIFKGLKVYIDRQSMELKPLKNGLPAFYTKTNDLIEIGDIQFSFVDNPVSIQFESQKRKEIIFGSKRYFSRPITCFLNNEDNIKVEIYLLDKNKNIFKEIDHHNGKFVLKMLEPALYYIETKTKENEKLEKFWVLPFKDVLIENKSISVDIKSNWTIKMKTDNPALSQTQKKSDCIISSDDFGKHKGRLFFFERNKLKYTSPFLFDFRKEILVYISGEEIENGSRVSIDDVSLDSQILFTVNNYSNLEYQVSIDYEGSMYGYPDFQIFQINPQIQSRLSLASIIQRIRKQSIKQTYFSITNTLSEVFRFSFVREELPLQLDSDNKVYSLINGLFSGYIVFDLLNLWKEPSIYLQDDFQPKKSGIYQIYGFQYDFSDTYWDIPKAMKQGLNNIKAYSNPIIIQHNLIEYEEASSNELHKLLIKFYKSTISNEQFEIANTLMKVLSNKENGTKIVKIFNNLENFQLKYDFALYNMLPQLYPILALWWELARDKNNPEIHFIDDTENSNALLDTFYLDDHPCFSWSLVTIADITSLSNSGLLPQEDMKALGLFCATYNSDDSMRTLAWLLMFWYREYCTKKQLEKEIQKFNEALQLIPTNPYGIWQISGKDSLPTAGNESENLLEDFRSKQLEKVSGMSIKAREQLEKLILITSDAILWKKFGKFLLTEPIYKQHYTQLFRASDLKNGIPERSLWCSFIALYFVYRQLNISNPLEEIIKLDIESLSILAKWLKRHSLRLFRKWYQYWMTTHWEVFNV